MPLRKIFKISHEKQTEIFSKIVKVYFNFKKHFYYTKNINYPEGQYILALWHAHQCGLYACKNRENLTVMISRSKDGDIISTATESLGIKTVRGSQSKGGATATLELVEHLKAGGNGAITIDGPRGPKRVVKKGIIEIAKISQVPIVPMIWYSPSFGFLKFKTWDEFRFPLCCIKLAALYGEPIHVSPDASEEKIEELRQKLETELNTLYAKIKKDFKALRKTGVV